MYSKDKFLIRFCFNSSSYTSFQLTKEEFEQRLTRKFWIQYIENKMKLDSIELTNILEKKVHIYNYTYQINSVVNDLKTNSEILDELFTGFDDNIFEGQVLENEKNEKSYILYRDEFNFRRMKGYEILKTFSFNSNITNNKNIKELINGNSRIISNLSKEQIQEINNISYENTNLKIFDFNKNYDDFNNLHLELKKYKVNQSFEFTINNKIFIITKLQHFFSIKKDYENNFGISIKEKDSSNFVYFESNMNISNLCFVSIDGVEFAGTAIYAVALTMGLHKIVFDKNKLPKYEILDAENKNKIKNKIMKI